MPSPFTFTLPPELSAKEPPERRGIQRDQVRLLVIDRANGKIEHSRFDKIDNYLRENDLLVFNSSRTLPASLRGCTGGCGGTSSHESVKLTASQSSLHGVGSAPEAALHDSFAAHG